MLMQVARRRLLNNMEQAKSESESSARYDEAETRNDEAETRNDEAEKRALAEQSTPVVSPWLQNGFHRYFLPRFLRRHFHTIAIERTSLDRAAHIGDAPLVVYGNHPSWWDPLLAHFLNRALYPGRQFYAPIDASALEQYRVFGKMGFFGVQMESVSGAAAFLKQSRKIVQSPRTSLWLTPEGRFTDPRDHSVTLMPGLAHLCSKMETGFAMPLCMEYVFWEERLPECLVRIGNPVCIADHADSKKDFWQQLLSVRMRQTQEDLATLAIAREEEPFENLLSGNKGVGGLYDSFRRAKSWFRGQTFRASHGDKFLS